MRFNQKLAKISFERLFAVAISSISFLIGYQFTLALSYVLCHFRL
jgi:hypothetical protein